MNKHTAKRVIQLAAREGWRIREVELTWTKMGWEASWTGAGLGCSEQDSVLSRLVHKIGLSHLLSK